MKRTSFRFAPLAAAAAIVATAPQVALAQQGPGAVLHSADRQTTLAVSYCPDEGDPWVECVSHDLTCKNGHELRLFVAGISGPEGNVIETVYRLVKQAYGSAEVQFRLRDTTIDMSVGGIELITNDMDGFWDASLLVYERSALLDAITESTTSLSATFGDTKLDFVPRPEDAAKLQQFKQACLAQ